MQIFLVAKAKKKGQPVIVFTVIKINLAEETNHYLDYSSERNTLGRISINHMNNIPVWHSESNMIKNFIRFFLNFFLHESPELNTTR